MESGSKVQSESKRLSNASEADVAKSEMMSQDCDHAKEEIELTESNRKESKPNKRLDSMEKCSEEENGEELEDVKKEGNEDAEKAKGKNFSYFCPVNSWVFRILPTKY